MSFVDEILAVVRELPQVGTARAEVDLGERERRFFKAFEERESTGDPVAKQLALKDIWPWLPTGVSNRFFSLLARDLSERVCPEVTAVELADALDTGGLWCVWGDPQMIADRLGGSTTRAFRFIEAFKRARALPGAVPGVPPAEALSYLRELGVIAARPGGWALTETGRVLQSLTGPAARRWLLHLEVRQSSGPMDGWRIHRSALAELLRRGQLDISEHPSSFEEVFPWSTESVARLVRFDVADESPGYGGWSAVLRADARPVLEECLADPPSPMAVLADSLARDVQDQALDPWVGSFVTTRSTGNLLAARMVAHEIRNAILPVRTVLRHLFEDAGPALAAYAAQRGRMEAGLSRALTFADEQLRVAELGRAPQALFAVGHAIATAVRATEPERNGRVTITIRTPTPDARVTGSRQLFEQVIVNLVRNAAQARPHGPVRVEVGACVADELLTVTVDDDGPGVAEGDRERIFEAGVSLTGSTGQGLYLARTAVAEMRGRIWCEPSPIGGARFVIQLPVPPRTP